ncbi:UDP-glycosyltransferase 73C3-like isoform X3 [Triticum urartu]|uniref:UDP-glycosyltransferase 73C3-like isoform X3 n=1 Tax=Triticum urartu TaxID=4572 RepID=UPI0020437A56|nr:UDP-glycosyltransferase 73C3-like isoform X3 [Triticum urartu]
MTLSGSGDGQSGSVRAHFVLVPMMAQGHTIPMTDMARLLAEHGAQVSFITTPVNAARLEGFAADVKAAGLAVQLVELHFPAAEFGLPDGYITYHNNVFQNVKDENELITITGFPTPLELTKAKCPGNFCIPGMEQIRKKFLEEELKSDGEVINSFQELETLYIESLEQTTKKKVWAVGPMCLCHRDNNTMAARGNKASMDEAQCLQWLDSMKPGSVVFVSFGSLACTTPQQLVELGLGLETSRKPFIWVIKAGAKLPEVEEWLADEFEERVKNRGMVIRGWAPQLMILQHQAIGGFVTHCGWNSTIEGICAGVPMITWPHFGEQFLNEKLLVDVLKTGMEVGVKGVTQWGSENQEVMVTRDEVQKAVNTLMDEGVAAEEMRVRAKDCAIKARRAFDEGGSSYDNIRLLIQEMEIKTNACRSVVDTDGNKLSFLV